MDRFLAFLIDLFVISAMGNLFAFLVNDMPSEFWSLLIIAYFFLTFFFFRASVGYKMMRLKIVYIGQGNLALFMLFRAVLKTLGMPFFFIPNIPFFKKESGLRCSIVDLICRTRVGSEWDFGKPEWVRKGMEEQ